MRRVLLRNMTFMGDSCGCDDAQQETYALLLTVLDALPADPFARLLFPTTRAERAPSRPLVNKMWS
jgi:hypothetical protein